MAQFGKRLETIVNGIATVISGVSFVGMVIFICLNVISRYLFKTSFNWAEEVTYLLFNWAVFFGVTLVYRYQGLTAIDIIVDRLPARARRGVMTLNYLLILAISVALVVWGYIFSMNAWIRKSPSLGIPYFFFDISIPLASIILAGYSLKFLVLTIKGAEIKSAALEERA